MAHFDGFANGKLAARSIHEHLAAEGARIEVTLDVEKIPTRDYRMLAGFEILNRETPPTLDLGRRTGIAEVETGYDAEQARIQGARCLVCHVQTIYDPEKCVLCNRCVDVCPDDCLHLVGLSQVAADERLLALADTLLGEEPKTLTRIERRTFDEMLADVGLAVDHVVEHALAVLRANPAL